MSGRIDHASEAKFVMKTVGETPMPSETAQVSMTAALTHATLALVEQQRIANLIALAPHFGGRLHTVLINDAADGLDIDREAGL